MEASRASQVETARGSGAARTTEKTILFVSLNVFGLRSQASRVVGMVGCLEAQLGNYYWIAAAIVGLYVDRKLR